MGVFAQWQPRYAEHGVATFPLIIQGKEKKPAIKGWAKTGLKGSEQLALKFPDLDAFAFTAGARSGTAIIDIDDPDNEDFLRDVLRRYGDTPVISRTGSGGFHLYYRYGGEARKIRPDPSEPVDFLGGGVVAAPPSQGSRGAYEFIRGSVADIARLPYIRGGADATEVQQAVTQELVKSGNRGNELFRHCMRQARHIDDFEAMLDIARTFVNDHIDRSDGHTFTDSDIEATARSAFSYEQRGLNRFGQAPTLNLPRDTVLAHAAKNPEAFALFSILQAHHKGQRNQFALAKGMAESLGWTLRRFKVARDYLISAGLIECVHAGGRGPKDAPMYRFC